MGFRSSRDDGLFTKRWLRRHRHDLLRLGVPPHIVDDVRNWGYVLDHGGDGVLGPWNASWLSEAQASELLGILVEHGESGSAELACDLRKRCGLPSIPLGKVVVVTKSDYDALHGPFLQALIDCDAELVCVVGEDCAAWKAAIEELYVRRRDRLDRGLTVTSHPKQTVAEVVEFASDVLLEYPRDVEVIEI